MHPPDSIVTAEQAAAAVDQFIAWRPLKLDGADQLFLSPITTPSRVQRLLGARTRNDRLALLLAHRPGPAPVVEAIPYSGGEPYFVGVIAPADERLPALHVRDQRSSYGPQQSDDPVADLAELAADVELLQLVAARCGVCAEIDREQGRSRQAARYDRELEQLVVLKRALERDVLPAYVDAFLGLWRELLVRYAPDDKRARQLVRPVTLRNLHQNGF